MNDEFDVVVVGGGGSGLATALRATQLGARVLVLEKLSILGGTTGIAIGSFTTNRSELQRQAGIEDDPDQHQADAGKFADPKIEARGNDHLRRFFLGESAATLKWLSDLGLNFYGPNPEPPNRVPRMHNVVPNAKAYIETFQTHLKSLGGTIRCDAKVIDLCRNSDRVTGVVAIVAGKQQTILAKHGVVLAAGDYSNSSDLIAQYKGGTYTAIEGINSNATGDGHKIAHQVGAKLINMDITYGPELRLIPPDNSTDAIGRLGSMLPNRIIKTLLPFVPRWLINRHVKHNLVTWQHPEDSLFTSGAILINSLGERYCNELQSPEREIATAQQPDKVGFALLDARLIKRFSAWPHFISTAPEIAYAYVNDYLQRRSDVATKGSLLEITRRRNIDIDSVKQTIEQHNRSINKPTIDSTDRSIQHRLEGDEWFLLGPMKSFFTTTEGGVAINQSMQALDDHEEVIDGLYAVGSNGMGGQILWGHGLHIAWAITSGRLVGEHFGHKIGGQVR